MEPTERPTRERAAAVVRRALAGEIGVPSDSLDLRLPLSQLPGANSVRLMRAVAAVEEYYGLLFEDRDLLAVETAADLTRLVERVAPPGWSR
jgi:acyl carrier protein